MTMLGHSYFGLLADLSGVLGVDCITLPLSESNLGDDFVEDFL